MSIVRIGTFNAENLFSRAKALNKKNFEATASRLAKIGDLERELAKKTYDKPRIIALYKEVKEYVGFNITRSKGRKSIVAFNKKTGKFKVDVDGRDDWEGFIELKRQGFDETTVKNTAKVIKALKADILCLVEVEDRQTMEQFDTDALGNMYAAAFSIQGNDPRGIDVGIYAKKDWTVVDVDTHIFERFGDAPLFSRDCLRVALRKDDITINVLANHFKSKSGRDQKASDAKRKRQAERVRSILEDSYDLKSDFVVVAGDLNDTPDSKPLAPLIATPRLQDVFEVSGTAQADRWTYHFKSNEQIDYLFVSDALASKLEGVEVERRGIADVDKLTSGAVKPFDSVTHWSNAASDHAGVVAQFKF
jgi:endonuclease/exonuclease/phosphatase family metal-dependent hydrolase